MKAKGTGMNFRHPGESDWGFSPKQRVQFLVMPAKETVGKARWNTVTPAKAGVTHSHLISQPSPAWSSNNHE